MSAAAIRPPTLVIPPFDAAAAVTFGPTGTPRVSSVLPMPLYSPGWSPPPTAAQLADPRDPCHCPRHDPAAGYSRNTLGYYGSSVPACSGCRRGEQDDIEFALVRAITDDESRLRDLLQQGHPTPEAGVLVTRLLANIAALESHTLELPTAPDYARRAIAIARTAATLYRTLIHPETPVSDIHGAYTAHVASLDRFTRTTFTEVAAAGRLFSG